MSLKGARAIALIRLLVAIFVLALLSTSAQAKCCNIITTQSCAGCNIFMCNCKHSCNCKDSCQTLCNEELDDCIADCTQENCNYCNSYFHACMGRCPPGDVAAENDQEAPGEGAQSCEAIYAAIDENGDRSISKAELVTFITAQRARLAETPLTDSPIDIALASVGGRDPDELFEDLDENADGEIDRIEAGLPKAAK